MSASILLDENDLRERERRILYTFFYTAEHDREDHKAAIDAMKYALHVDCFTGLARRTLYTVSVGLLRRSKFTSGPTGDNIIKLSKIKTDNFDGMAVLEEYQAIMSLGGGVPITQMHNEAEILRHAVRDRQMAQFVTEQAKILQQGLVFNQKLYEGSQGVYDYNNLRLGQIMSIVDHKERTKKKGDISEINIAEYTDPSLNKDDFLTTGISFLDDNLGGIGLGELWAVMGYTNSGKSMVCVNIAVASLLQGKNVIYFATEQPSQEIWNRVFARFAMEPEHYERAVSAGDAPFVIDDLKFRRFNKSTIKFDILEQIKLDLASEDKTGKLTILQYGNTDTFTDVATEMQKRADAGDIYDLVVIDSLDLLNEGADHANWIDFMTKVKSFCNGFNGTGTRIVTPWQFGRTRFENALQYAGELESIEPSLGMAAHTAEINSRADVVIGIIPLTRNSTKFWVLKNRNGGKPPPMRLRHMFQNAWFKDGEQANILANL